MQARFTCVTDQTASDWEDDDLGSAVTTFHRARWKRRAEKECSSIMARQGTGRGPLKSEQKSDGDGTRSARRLPAGLISFTMDVGP